jgi:hypothetical protein
MKYIPPFDLIRRSVEISTVRGELRVNVSYADFIELLKLLIGGATIDEAWYLRRYEDIARAVEQGEIGSAHEHFVQYGYFEGRLPRPIQVDEAWYLEQYPDVADSIKNGSVSSAQSHFDEDGYREGRLPFRM